MSKEEFLMTLKAFAEIGLGSEDLYKRMVNYIHLFYLLKIYKIQMGKTYLSFMKGFLINFDF
jgi:hypothetical protein